MYGDELDLVANFAANQPRKLDSTSANELR